MKIGYYSASANQVVVCCNRHVRVDEMLSIFMFFTCECLSLMELIFLNFLFMVHH